MSQGRGFSWGMSENWNQVRTVAPSPHSNRDATMLEMITGNARFIARRGATSLSELAWFLATGFNLPMPRHQHLDEIVRLYENHSDEMVCTIIYEPRSRTPVSTATVCSGELLVSKLFHRANPSVLPLDHGSKPLLLCNVLTADGFRRKGLARVCVETVVQSQFKDARSLTTFAVSESTSSRQFLDATGFSDVNGQDGLVRVRYDVEKAE